MLRFDKQKVEEKNQTDNRPTSESPTTDRQFKKLLTEQQVDDLTPIQPKNQSTSNQSATDRQFNGSITSNRPPVADFPIIDNRPAVKIPTTINLTSTISPPYSSSTERLTLLKPTLLQIREIESILEPYIKEGIILKRERDEIAQNIRSYTLLYRKGEPIGVGALHIYTPYLGEVRSLAIREGEQRRGYGKILVRQLIQEAFQLGLKEVLVLTYTKQFFIKLGFKEIPKETIPEKKIWSDCINCKFFPICREVALIKYL